MEEIAGQQAIGLSTQERPPGGIQAPWGRTAPPGAQDPPHRGLADLVTEPAQFAAHPAVSPGRVLPRKPQYQGADLRAGARPAWPARARPLACDQPTVPGQQRTRRDQPIGAQHGWKQPGQHRPEYVYQALKAGASGFLLKDAPAAELVNGVRTIARGESLLAPAVTRALIGRFANRVRPAADAAAPRRDPLAALSPREREVPTLIARGLSNAETATEMVLSGETVKTYVSRILTKLTLRRPATPV